MELVHRDTIDNFMSGASVQFKEAFASCRGNVGVLKDKLWGDLIENGRGSFREFSGESQPRELAPFFKDSEINFDNLLIRVGRDRLVITDDLLSRGLGKTLPNYMAKFEHEWQKITDSGKAERTMYLGSSSENGLADITQAKIPLPLTFWTWEINMRDMLVAQSGGLSIDTEHIEHRIRSAYELMEDSVINGFSENYRSLPVYGMLNHPNVGTFTIPVAWDDVTVEGSDILNDLHAMRAVARLNKRTGNKIVYMTPDYDEKLDLPYTAQYGGEGSIRNYLRNNLDWLEDIVSVDYLPADTVVMFDPEARNMELINDGGMTILPYDIAGTFVSKWIGFTGMVPAAKDDADGITGTIVGTV